MSDWLLNVGDQSAEKMKLFHLAVDQKKSPSYHLRLAQVLEDTFKRIDVPSYETNEELNSNEKFACTHALYHCIRLKVMIYKTLLIGSWILNIYIALFVKPN